MRQGTDVGFGWTKVENLRFPSVVGPGRDRKLKGGLSDRPQTLVEELDVTIDERRYFVGSLALRESFAGAATLSKDNAANPHKRILLLTAAALMAQKDWQAVRVVTGLPIADYRSQREAFADSLRSCATIRIADKLRHIEIADVAVFPQGAGALWGELLDTSGRLIDTPLAKAKIAVIDVGFRDTNWCVLDSLDYIDKQSNSATIGIYNAHKAVADELAGQGIDLLVQDVDSYVRREGYDATRHYRDLAEQILGVLSTQWNMGEFKRIFLAGGGARLLERHLVEQLKCWTVADPQFANARGFQKVAHMKWRD